MEIRQLTAEDAENYWKLRLEALKQNPEAFATSYEEAVKRKNPIEQVVANMSGEGSYTFGAWDGNELFGMVTLMLERHQKLSHRANIFAMYVTPNKQGNGAGSLLVKEVIETAKSIKGMEKLNLTVVSTNEKAKNLYAKFGFKSFGLEKNALKIGDTYYDEEYMDLKIN